MCRALAGFLFVSLAVAQPADADRDLSRACAAHRWFDLRAPSRLAEVPFFSGALAAAFNAHSRNGNRAPRTKARDEAGHAENVRAPRQGSPRPLGHLL
jgi:hypothetical protein